MKLKDSLHAVREEAARPTVHVIAAGSGIVRQTIGATQMQVNMQGTVGKRGDAKGSKIEEMPGLASMIRPADNYSTAATMFMKARLSDGSAARAHNDSSKRRR
jgi:hypothetical protein